MKKLAYVLKLTDCTKCEHYLSCLTQKLGSNIDEYACVNAKRLLAYGPPYMSDQVIERAVAKIEDWGIFLNRVSAALRVMANTVLPSTKVKRLISIIMREVRALQEQGKFFEDEAFDKFYNTVKKQTPWLESQLYANAMFSARGSYTYRLGGPDAPV